MAPGKKAINSAQTYEDAIRNIIYGNNNLQYQQRKYSTIVNGVVKNGIADNIVHFNGLDIAIDAKYVRDWSVSIRNPNSPIGSRDFAIKEQITMLEQAQKYNAAFDYTVYHTNSVDLANYYSKVFSDAGLKNFEFVITSVN